MCGAFSTVLGAIYVGNATAFQAFVGSFIVLSTLSYLAAILPFTLTGRFSRSSQIPGPYVDNMKPGPYKMGDKLGYTVNIISCLYMIVFIVIYCFPPAKPVTAINMNYASVIAGAVSLSALLWWFVKSDKYVGPQAMTHEEDTRFVRGVNSEGLVAEK